MKTETPRINSNVVNNYFTNIFQSNRIINNPIVENIIESVNRYTFYVPLLDDKFSPSEFNDAINEIGKGTGIDGLDPMISYLFPSALRIALLDFLNLVFENSYPCDWEKHALFPILKKGHTDANPKMRGIAVSCLLPKIYDIMINN